VDKWEKLLKVKGDEIVVVYFKLMHKISKWEYITSSIICFYNPHVPCNEFFPPDWNKKYLWILLSYYINQEN